MWIHWFIFVTIYREIQFHSLQELIAYTTNKLLILFYIYILTLGVFGV